MGLARKGFFVLLTLWIVASKSFLADTRASGTKNLPVVTDQPEQNDSIRQNDIANQTLQTANGFTYLPVFYNVSGPDCDFGTCSPTEYEGCSCLEICIQTGDCCYDYLLKLLPPDPSLRQVEELKMLAKESELSSFSVDRWTCISDKYHHGGYWMIDFCLDGMDDTNCSHSGNYGLHDIPVNFDISEKLFVIFKNVYCALCNNISVSQVMFWNMTAVSCRIQDTATQLSLEDLDEMCMFNFRPAKHLDYLRCDWALNKYKKCPSYRSDSEKELLALCESYIYPVTVVSVEFTGVTKTLYKNPHCAACDTGWRNFSSGICTEADLEFEKNESIANLPVDLRVMFEFNPGYSIITKQVTCGAVSCDNMKVFDCFQMKCRPVSCTNADYWSQSGLCSFESSVIYYKPNITPAVKHDVLIKICHNETMFGNNTSFAMGGSDVLVNAEVPPVDFYKTLFDATSNCNLIYFGFQNKNDTWKYIKTLLNTAAARISDISDTRLIIEAKNFDTEDTLQCALPDILIAFDNLEIDESLDNVHVNTVVNTSAMFAMNEGVWKINVLEPNIFEVRSFVVCKKIRHFTKPCTLVKLEASEIIVFDDYIQLKNTSLKIKQEDVELINDDIYICAHLLTPFEYKVLYKYPEHFTIVSIISSSITVVALSIVLLIHFTFNIMRNIHGLNMIGLSMSLLITHGLLLLQTMIIKGMTTCIIFAAVLHFGLLSVFMWLSIIALDITVMIKSRVVVSVHNKYKKFRKYVFVAIGVPVAIVAVCLILDATNANKTPGYGNGGICWVTSTLGLIAFVIVPVLLAVTINIVLFVLSIYSIQSKKFSQRGKSNNKSYLMVYFKLFLILGLTWVLAFFNSFLDSDILWFIHIILNGLQGLSLLICTVTNARNSRMFRKETIATVNCQIQM